MIWTPVNCSITVAVVQYLTSPAKFDASAQWYKYYKCQARLTDTKKSIATQQSFSRKTKYF